MTEPSNYVEMRIVSEHDEGEPRRVTIQRIFKTPHYTRDEVLEVVEDALRAAGYHCPPESLIVEEPR